MRQRTRRFVVCPQSRVQIKIGLSMVKALRRWLEANGLFAIVTRRGRCALILLSMLLVLGGYLV